MRNFTKTHALDVIGNSSQLSMIYNRAKNEKNYTVKNASWDVIGQGANVHGAAMLGASIAVGAAAGMGGVIAAPAMPAIAAFAKIFGTGVGLLKVGDSLAEATLPRLHQKVTSKYK